MSSYSAPLQSIGGLASGLDTNSIVAQLMSVERQPLVRSQEQQAIETVRQQALKDVQTRLQSLSTAIAGLRDVTTWAPTQTVTSSDSTRVGAQYLSGAAAGSYQFTVSQLARADQWQSNGSTTSAASGDTLTIGVGGKSISVNVNAGDSLDTIASAINATNGAPVFATVVNSKLILSSQTTGFANSISVSSSGTLASDLGFTHTASARSSGTLQAANGADTLRIGLGGTTVDVAIGNGDSLDTIASKINGTSGTPVSASVVGGKLLLAGSATGSQSISVTSVGGGTLASDLALTNGTGAQDAVYSVDGVTKTNASNTITDAIAGVQLTLNAPTLPSTPVSITVGSLQPNTTAIQSKIQAFVDQYNSTVDFIHQKLDEKRVANPQSIADKEQGLLNSDTSLDDLLANMRSAVSNTFSGANPSFNQLGLVGLSTGDAVGSGTISQDSLEGKLTLDASKLSSALTTNFGDVKAMFTNGTGDYSSEGLAQRLDTLVNAQIDPTSGMLTTRISSEDSLIQSFQDDQAQIQMRLDLKEQQLRAQFTAMETALSQAQSQGNWLSGQIAGLPSWR